MQWFPCADNGQTSAVHIGFIVSAPILIRDEILRDQLINTFQMLLVVKWRGGLFLSCRGHTTNTLEWSSSRVLLTTVTFQKEINGSGLMPKHVATNCIHYCVEKNGGIEFSSEETVIILSRLHPNSVQSKEVLGSGGSPPSPSQKKKKKKKTKFKGMFLPLGLPISEDLKSQIFLGGHAPRQHFIQLSP